MESLRENLPLKRRGRRDIEKSLSDLSAVLNVEINDLFELNFNTVHFDTLTNWCAFYTTRWTILKALLQIRNYERLSDFESTMTYTLEREATITTILNGMPVSKKGVVTKSVVREFYERTNKLEYFRKLTQEQVMEIVDSIKNDTYHSASVATECARVILSHFGLNTDRLQLIYNSRYNTVIADKLRSRGGWIKDAVESLETAHRKRLQKSSASPEDTLKTHMSHQARILECFEQYIYETYGKSMEEWLSIAELDEVVEMIQVCSEHIDVRNERVKSQHTKHHAFNYVNNGLFILRTVSGVKCRDGLMSLTPTEVLGGIEDKRETLGGEVRRHFTEEEMHRIFDVARDDVQFTLILRILKETGLRIGALTSLYIRDVLHDDGDAKHTTAVLDKGRKLRRMIFGEQLQSDIVDYVNTLDSPSPSDFLFSYGKKHISPNSVRKKLIRYADRCDIRGIHIHPHAFRHTLVNRLVEEGNDISKVSKFIGHTTSSTTEKYYWTTKQTDIAGMMNIPWLGQYNIPKPDDVADDRYRRDMNAMSTDILLVCINLLTLDQKVNLKKIVPYIDTFIEDLQDCSSMCSSSVASDS